MFHVYKITCTVNGKCYIGKTIKSAEYRWRHHCTPSKRGDSLLGRAINKYGRDKFRVEVLYEGVDDREILAVERAMIAQYGTVIPNGYNVCIGGQGTGGRKMTEDQRSAVSRRMIGNKHGRGRKGKKMTPEQRAKNAEKLRNLVVAPDVRVRGGLTRRGRKRPISVGANISAAKKGKAVPGNYKAVICVTRNTIYNSIKTAAQELGLSTGAVFWALKKEHHTAGGQQFVYAVPK